MMTETKFYMFSKINHKTIMKEEDRWGKTLNGTIAYSLQEASSGGVMHTNVDNLLNRNSGPQHANKTMKIASQCRATGPLHQQFYP